MAGIGTKRRKHRTHVKPAEQGNVPKSMVIRTNSSEMGKSVSALTRDFRRMMEPHTASRLKERSRNRMRDYLAMAGPLGVSHAILFSRSDRGPNLRIVKTPRGPTLQFSVLSYTLGKDVRKLQRNPKSPGVEFLTPPLLVLNNFKAAGGGREHPEETLMVSTFQNMFPPITPDNASLSAIKRVILLDKRPDGTIELRHYSIGFKSVGNSRAVRRATSARVHKDLPSLHGVRDISEFVLQGKGINYMSDSEVDDPENRVDVVKKEEPDEGELPPEQAAARASTNTRQKAVRLTEIGPRMTMRLAKVMEGVSYGKVLYHATQHKSEAEVERLDKTHTQARALRDKRKREQAANVQRKRQALEAKRQKRRGGRVAKEAAAEEEEEDDHNGGDGDDDDDDAQHLEFDDLDDYIEEHDE